LHRAAVEALPPFEHAFTHFTLEALPWRVTPRGAATVAAGKASMWLPLADIAGAALPSPIRRLLKSLE
jgi:A/G-specific adenine glycosylase